MLHNYSETNTFKDKKNTIILHTENTNKVLTVIKIMFEQFFQANNYRLDINKIILYIENTIKILTLEKKHVLTIL
jgi:hypothetical protein